MTSRLPTLTISTAPLGWLATGALGTAMYAAVASGVMAMLWVQLGRTILPIAVSCLLFTTVTAFVVESNTKVTALLPETSIIPGVPLMETPGARANRSCVASTMSRPGAAVEELIAWVTNARNLIPLLVLELLLGAL